MKKLDHKMLSDGERELVLDARPKQLRRLDEEQLIDLHKRVRRARNKYSKMYRRRAGDQVGADRARGKASKKQKKVAMKAEIFEDLLSDVSRQLGVVAHENAERLRDERLERSPIDHRKNAGNRASKKRHKARAAAR